MSPSTCPAMPDSAILYRKPFQTWLPPVSHCLLLLVTWPWLQPCGTLAVLTRFPNLLSKFHRPQASSGHQASGIGQGMPSRITTGLVSRDCPSSVLKVWGPRQPLGLRQVGTGGPLLPSEKFYP